MSQDQDRANAFLKRLVAQTKAVHHPLTVTQTKPTVLVRKEGVPEDFSQQITPRRQRKIQGNVFQGKRRYHLDYQAPREQDLQYGYEQPIDDPHRAHPTRSDRLGELAFNDVVRKAGVRNNDGTMAYTNIVRRGIIGPSVHHKLRSKLNDRSRGVEWMRQIRGIPAPKKKPKT